MAAWRTLGTWLIVLSTATTAWGQSYSLTEKLDDGTCARYQLIMNLTGDMTVVKDDKPVALKLTATATHHFAERLMHITGALPQKSARIYEMATAVIQVDRDRSERALRPEHNLLVAQRLKDQTQVYSPKDALSYEEMELTNGHFDTLTMLGLLPTKQVAVKDTWKVATDTVQGLCHLEGVTTQDLVCKLEEVKDDVAVVSVKGSVAGIDLGAQVKMTIDASYRFDLKTSRITTVEWKEKDDRGQGPASPASVVETTYQVKRMMITEPETLSDVALISVPPEMEAPEDMLLLSHRDPKSRFNLKYTRMWQPVGQTDDHLVMRLMDRGDFVAQATFTPWVKAKSGEHLTPEEFRKAMANTPGWEQHEVLQSGVVSKEGKGPWIYRVSAVGVMDDMKLIQNFYLVAGPNGDQLVIAFTTTPTQVERLGSRDLVLVEGVELPK
jgi:hypothetical protein